MALKTNRSTFWSAAAVQVLLIGTMLSAVTFHTDWLFCEVVGTLVPGDSITEAGCGTWRHLDSYDDQPDEAVAWLLEYHGEAPGTAVMLTVLGWVEQEPAAFVDLLNRVPDDSLEPFAARLADAAYQSGATIETIDALASYARSSERLEHLLDRLRDPYPGSGITVIDR